MKSLLKLTIAMSLFTNHAFALSCAAPNLARDYNNAAQSDKTYQVGYGTLVAIEPIIDPNTKQTNRLKKKSYSVKAEFNGGFLSRGGFGKAKTIPVTVNISCLSVWCGSFPKSSEKMIAFLEQTSKGLTLHSGPCPGKYKTSPSNKEIRTMKWCMRNGTCSDQQIKALDYN